MNFFKSILLDDPDPPKFEDSQDSGSNTPLKSPLEDRSTNSVATDGAADAWSFGGLIKTITTRSESMIETYRRDLQEFGSGLKKETEIVREVASRAVKDLPSSLEAGTSAAHGVLDGVLKSTANIISKDTQFFGSDGEPETPETNRMLNSGRYSWFEAQWSAIQSDPNTFVEDPEDVEEYKKWKLRFDLEQKKDEIEGVIGENGVLEDVYTRVVPSMVDDRTFWCRYFYRVDKLKQQERVRASLVKRAIVVDDDDELSWDVDDDENGNGGELTSGLKVKGGDGAGDKGLNDKKGEGSSGRLSEEKELGSLKVDDGNKNNVVESINNISGDLSVNEKEMRSEEVAGVKSGDRVKPEEAGEEVNCEEVAGLKTGEKVKSEESVAENNKDNTSVDKDEPGKKDDVSVAPKHQSKMEEADSGWDELEYIESGDEKIISTTGGSPNRAELRKRLSAAEDDEDLSWDIEDDDQQAKS